MAITTLRDMAIDIAPPWLQDEVGGTILRAIGTVCDALCERTAQGVKMRYPGAGTPTALGYVGNDRLIERGPLQTDDGYVAQLDRAISTWQNAGGGRTILAQLRAYYAPSSGPPMRLVSDGTTARNRNVWHEIDPSTGHVAKTTISPATWRWGLERRWYAWAIVDMTGRWILDRWGDPGTWGDGGVWGSNMTPEEATRLNAILLKWKPEGKRGQLILTFNPSTFSRLDSLGDHPSGNGYDYAWQAAQLANFLSPQTS